MVNLLIQVAVYEVTSQSEEQVEETDGDEVEFGEGEPRVYTAAELRKMLG